MKLMRLVACLWVCVVAVITAQPTFAADAPDVPSALTAWKAAVESGSVDKIMTLYDKDAIMFSVFAIKPLETPDALKKYYKKVVQNPDIKVSITEVHPRQFGDVALNSGLYTLSYSQDGETVSIPSRFSFTYLLKNGKWMIIDHHSSKVPLAEGKQ